MQPWDEEWPHPAGEAELRSLGLSKIQTEPVADFKWE